MAIPQIGKKTKRSVKLTADEWGFLQSLQKSAHTSTEFAHDMGIDRVTLSRIVALGSGSEANIKTIRRKLARRKQLAA